MFIPPSSSSLPSLNRSLPSSTSDLAVLIGDDRAISSLIDKLLDRANLSEKDLAVRLGVAQQTVHQYRTYRRKRPSIQWLVKLAEVCGARIYIEFPSTPLIK